MKKVKELLSKIRVNWSLLAMIAYLVKVLMISTSYADGIVMMSLTALYGFTAYLKSKEPKVSSDQKMREEIRMIKDVLTKVNLGNTLNNTKQRRF